MFTGVPDRASKKLFSSATLHPNSKDYLNISQKLLSATAARYSIFWLAQLLSFLMHRHPGNDFYAILGYINQLISFPTTAYTPSLNPIYKPLHPKP